MVSASPSSRMPGFGAWTWVFYIFLYLPLVILVVFSFNAGRSATVWSGFSLDWYARAFGNESIQRATVNSLIVAFSAMTAATVLALLAALALMRGRRFRGGTVFRVTLLAPLMIPEIVTAVATLTFFSALGMQLGLFNVFIAHTVFCIPFAYLPIAARLSNLDESLECAARDLYAGAWRAFRRVTLPLAMPGIAAGAMLAFIISLDDFVITLMVADAGSTTLPVYIFGMVRMGTSPEINAVSTALLAVTTVIIVAHHGLTRAGKKPGLDKREKRA
ncbi:MAG: ABC transporter permease [Gammaproteobacteria bacterium]|nr:ABC transporter permease [Gammaproteobacteria bacterium]